MHRVQINLAQMFGRGGGGKLPVEDVSGIELDFFARLDFERRPARARAVAPGKKAVLITAAREERS
jgi:hypothetical protein